MWRNFGKCWMKNTRCFNHGDFGQLPPPFLLRLGLRFVLPWTFWVSLLSFVVDFICFSSLEGIRGLRIRWRQWKLHRVFAIHSHRAILSYGINEKEIDKSQGYIKANIKNQPCTEGRKCTRSRWPAAADWSGVQPGVGEATNQNTSPDSILITYEFQGKSHERLARL